MRCLSKCFPSKAMGRLKALLVAFFYGWPRRYWGNRDVSMFDTQFTISTVICSTVINRNNVILWYIFIAGYVGYTRIGEHFQTTPSHNIKGDAMWYQPIVLSTFEILSCNALQKVKYCLVRISLKLVKRELFMISNLTQFPVSLLYFQDLTFWVTPHCKKLKIAHQHKISLNFIKFDLPMIWNLARCPISLRYYWHFIFSITVHCQSLTLWMTNNYNIQLRQLACKLPFDTNKYCQNNSVELQVCN